MKYHRYKLTDSLLLEVPGHSIPLQTCIQYFNFDAFLRLFQSGALLDTYVNGFNILDEACNIGHLSLVQYLVSVCGFSVSQTVDSIQFKGTTPLHFACLHGHLPIVQFLVKNHAFINAQNIANATPLISAASHGLPIVKFLVENGARINMSSSYGITPLHIACQEGDLQTIKYLIEHGARLEANDFDRRTPLNYVPRRYYEVTKYLISIGAKTYGKNFSPLPSIPPPPPPPQ